MPRLDNNLIDGNKPSMCGAGKRIIVQLIQMGIYTHVKLFVRTIYKFGNILDDNWYEEFLCNIMDKKKIVLKVLCIKKDVKM